MVWYTLGAGCARRMGRDFGRDFHSISGYFGIYWQFIDINSAYCVALWSFVKLCECAECWRQEMWTEVGLNAHAFSCWKRHALLSVASARLGVDAKITQVSWLNLGLVDLCRYAVEDGRAQISACLMAPRSHSWWPFLHLQPQLWEMYTHIQ